MRDASGQPDLQAVAVVLAAGDGWPGGQHHAVDEAPWPGGGATAVLSAIIGSLTAAGIRDVTVVTGAQDRGIRTFLTANYPGLDLGVAYDGARAGAAVSPALAPEPAGAADPGVLVVTGDLLFDQAVLARLIACPSGNAAAVTPYRTGMDGTVVDVTGGLVTGVYPAAAQHAGFCLAGRYKPIGLYRFSRHFLQDVPDVLGRLCGGGSVLDVLAGTDLPARTISALTVGASEWAHAGGPGDWAAARFGTEPVHRAAVLASHRGGFWKFPGLTDFSSPVNQHFPPGPVIAALRFALPDLAASQPSAQHILNEQVAGFLRCRPDRLHAIAGVHQVLPALRRLRPGPAAIPASGPGEYAGCWPGARRCTGAPGAEWPALATLARAMRLAVIAAPGSAAGTPMPVTDIHALARGSPHTMFLIDETYQPFSAGPSLIGLLEEEPLPNLAVAASLGPSTGLPGLGLGYLYSCDPELITAVASDLPGPNLSSVAELALQLLTRCEPAYRESLRRTARDRDALRQALGAVPVIEQVYPSAANFLLVRLTGRDPRFAARARDWLLGHDNISVLDSSGQFADQLPRLRIAARRAGDSTRLVTALNRIRPAILEAL